MKMVGTYLEMAHKPETSAVSNTWSILAKSEFCSFEVGHLGAL